MVLSITAVIIMVDLSNFAFAKSINPFHGCVTEHIKGHPILLCTPTKHHI